MDIIKILCVIITFQLLFLSLFLITYKKGNKTSNYILSAFLFFNALLVLNLLLKISGVSAYSHFPPLSLIGNSNYFMLGPLIFLYTKSLCYRDYKIRVIDIFHFLPLPLLVAAALIIHLLALSKTYVYSSGQMSISCEHCFFATIYVLLLGYISFTLLALKRYRRELKDYFSNIRPINLSWLSLILISFLLMLLVDAAILVLSLLGASSSIIGKQLLILTLLINFVFAAVLAFMGLRQPGIFTGIESGLKYGKARLSKAEADLYMKNLKHFMQQEKPHLDPSLNLNDLAERLSIPARQLSQVINDSLKQNFFDMISSYRIEEAKFMLLDPSHRDKTILEILYDAGFNSKSSFNNLFKKKTGVTPSEFRRINQH
ncbi:MAG: AraC family transcriptional regulator [Candidatus Aminicenantes bacterium]|nr:MAG: AraC family transcriptional regulator [Candidatus Aminicenantes bacterium]